MSGADELRQSTVERKCISESSNTSNTDRSSRSDSDSDIEQVLDVDYSPAVILAIQEVRNVLSINKKFLLKSYFIFLMVFHIVI